MTTRRHHADTGRPPEPSPPTPYTLRNASERSLLWRLADYTDLVERNNSHSITVNEYIETPYDEYGIIDRKLLFKRLLGSVASEYHWNGSFVGPHHLIWPRRAYSPAGTRTPSTKITSDFRESPSLKVTLPRELHDWLHYITPMPTMPDLDVMEQYILEQEQVSKLYGIVRYGGLSDVSFDPAKKELFRHAMMLDKLKTMEDGQVGLMPNREMLSQVPLAEARQILRHLALPLGISARRSCQQVFFKDYS